MEAGQTNPNRTHCMQRCWAISIWIALLLLPGQRARAGQLWITEVSAHDDWVEIYNAGTETEALGDWRVYDNGSNHRLSGSLPAKQFRVFAVPFNLRRGGEAVGLFYGGLPDPSRQRHEFQYRLLYNDLTWNFPVFDGIVETNLPTYLA